MKHNIKLINDNIILELDTPLSGKVVHSLFNKLADSWPVKSFTATIPMNDFIGNVISVSENKCEVKGVYRGIEQVVKNIRIVDKDINIANRVMVTEFINVNGEMEFLATKKRILLEGNGSGLNFINIGFSNTKESHILRIDVYFGHSRLIFQNIPCYSYYRGENGK